MRHKPRLKRGVIKTWERLVRTCTPMRMPARGALDAERQGSGHGHVENTP